MQSDASARQFIMNIVSVMVSTFKCDVKMFREWMETKYLSK